jgi:hypothetical protein
MYGPGPVYSGDASTGSVIQDARGGPRSTTRAGASMGEHLPGGPTEHPQPNHRVQATGNSLRSCFAPALGNS